MVDDYREHHSNDANQYLDGELGDWDIDQFLSTVQNQEKQRLENEIATIEEQISDRDDLHRELVHELERELERYENELDKLVRLSGSRERKQEQKKRIRELSLELRRERRQHWQDRQKLMAERRELMGELSSLEDDLLTQFF